VPLGRPKALAPHSARHGGHPVSADRSASVLARLLALAKRRGDDHSLLLNRFALERLLHRLSVSAHAERFLLKGALLFSLWYEQPHRPTRDADLLGFGPDDAAHLVATFREIAAIVADDGIAFDAESVRVEPIREDSLYGGLRVRLVGRIGSARCALQVDVGFGDAVTPHALTVEYPALLPGFASPVLRVYPVYTVIAEKYHAMVVLGLANSRMKDFYDLAVIAARTELDGATLAQAIAATFSRRATPLPAEPPMSLKQAFGTDVAKQRQWAAFLDRNRLSAPPLAEAVGLLYTLLWPATQVAVAGSGATARWIPDARGWA
jgi:hypothetical protein